MAKLVLKILALVAFTLAAFGVIVHPRVNLVALGLGLWLGSELL